MNKYDSLVNILDRLRFDAPPEFKRYRPNLSDEQAVNQARSRALIHLYLQVNFGILDFKARERLITDKSCDAGIDAYHIDQENKRVIFVQSKFRTSKENFNKKNISFEELLKMDVARVIDGESLDEDGNEYNGKIKQLQREISELPDIGRYKYEVVVLANVPSLKYWGKGYATEAAKGALRIGFTLLSLPEVVSFTTVRNYRSRVVMERLGMKLMGETFEHPNVPEGSKLREHCLYRLSHEQWVTHAA